ncbi:hypothetical protein GQ54DRAFT_299702 [Martensiomyces pterosporus]|nr:hypothetical protein GQ54DRAFT_299702 [Martensiomyces pterosporus]
MGRVSVEQVLARIKQNGTYDAMRRELLDSFYSSACGKEFDFAVNDTLQWLSEDMSASRIAERAAQLERRVIERLERQGNFDRLEKDARNHWLTKDKRAALKDRILQAVSEAGETGSTEVPASGVVARPLEIDPPRMTVNGSGSGPRTHNYYRRGDAVAAFVPTTDPLCQTPQYACFMVEITACDAPKNTYTVCDPDAQEGAQDSWVVYWDQILLFKRPYEYTYRIGDQVYALYRDDLAADTAVTTEFFPGRVEQAGPMSLAVRFDAGGLAHVYYDEVFAAGRAGFLRRLSSERRKKDAPDAMTRMHGELVPSFTGFWTDEAEPALGKRGRKVRYRPLPPFLVQPSPRRHQPTVEPPKTEDSFEQSTRVSSDMEIDSSSSSPPSPQRAAVQKTTATSSEARAETAPRQALPDTSTSSTAPENPQVAAETRSVSEKPLAQPAPAKAPLPEKEDGEEGEIDVDEDEGEIASGAASMATSPRGGDQRSGGLPRRDSSLRARRVERGDSMSAAHEPRWRRGDSPRRRDDYRGPSRYDSRSPSRGCRPPDRYTSPSRSPSYGARRDSFSRGGSGGGSSYRRHPHAAYADRGGYRRSPSPNHGRRSPSRSRYQQRSPPRYRDDYRDRRRSRSRSRSRGPMPVMAHQRAMLPPMPFGVPMLSPQPHPHPPPPPPQPYHRSYHSRR